MCVIGGTSVASLSASRLVIASELPIPAYALFPPEYTKSPIPGFVVEKKETRLRRFGFDFEKIYNLVFVSLFSFAIYELIFQFYSTNRVWLKKKRDLFSDFGNL